MAVKAFGRRVDAADPKGPESVGLGTGFDGGDNLRERLEP